MDVDTCQAINVTKTHKMMQGSCMYKSFYNSMYFKLLMYIASQRLKIQKTYDELVGEGV